jgi:hypothetical protein
VSAGWWGCCFGAGFFLSSLFDRLRSYIACVLTFLGDKITTVGIGDVAFFSFFFLSSLLTNDYDAATCLKHDYSPSVLLRLLEK